MLGLIEHKEKKAFRDLLRIDQVRGAHSVGVYHKGLHKEGIIKKALSPDEMFSMKVWTEAVSSLTNLYIGHNRWATQGAVNSVNAHPFEQGIIIGAHNGTLRQQSLLPDFQDYTVDSENIMHSLNTLGVENTVEKLNGAYALTWYNKEENTMNFVRNAERPLYYCRSVDHKTLFWASEEWMFFGSLGRQGIKFTNPQMFEVDKHYSIEVPNQNIINATPIGVMSVQEVAVYEAPPPVKRDHNTNTYSSHQHHGAGGNVYGMPHPFTGKDKVKNGDVIYFWQGYIDASDRYMACIPETDEDYYVRVHFGNLCKVREMLTDELKADSMFQGIVCGNVNGKEPSVIVNPSTVKQVDAKKQEELLMALMV